MQILLISEEQKVLKASPEGKKTDLAKVTGILLAIDFSLNEKAVEANIYILIFFISFSFKKILGYCYYPGIF